MTVDTTDLGTYVEHHGRPAVRFVRTYPHPVERVWQAIADADELRHWFPCSVALEQRAGGTITYFADDPNLGSGQAEGEQPSGAATGPDGPAVWGTGTVLVCEPPHRLAYTWGGDELHYELEEVGDGGCRLTFINVLQRADTAARSGAGWTVCLHALQRAVDGNPGDGPHGRDALPWTPIYEAYIAAGLPHGAPIPNVERR
jgi:uncharacterized protein YndB with AHSA1/START domain